MSNKQPEQGAIQLDNQCIQVRIVVPSGCLQVVDKVTGLIWSMKAENGSGSLTLPSGDPETEIRETEYVFGRSGDRGILFHQNYYMVRSTSVEDFHDVSLTGILGDDPETQVTIRYLLSTTFPVLNCYCYISGAQQEDVRKIQFPYGFHLASRATGEEAPSRLWLPRDLEELQSPETVDRLSLWEPLASQNHRVVGSPFFILTQRHADKGASGCIGYLQHPLSVVDILHTDQERYAHPSSSHLDITGKEEKNPYYFRYQFVPSDDPEALSWLYREYLFEQEARVQLE